ncbi:hypothetical protein [Lacrimispora amygdalina]|uniref:hypothetical protein n=1 Tax=Lacrimispora amygdalina TaxID=253257 RepID=UPI000BE33882|nr:hypothetical protein [Lacrimispora amygdalina]
MKVFAPNKQYTGTSASVSFCNGVGETEDLRLLHWFKSHGYKVEDLPESEDPAEDPGKAQQENPEAPEENVEKELDKEIKKGKSSNQKAGE